MPVTYGPPLMRRDFARGELRVDGDVLDLCVVEVANEAGVARAGADGEVLQRCLEKSSRACRVSKLLLSSSEFRVYSSLNTANRLQVRHTRRRSKSRSSRLVGLPW